MRVISKARLREFWTAPGHASASGPLRAWYAHVNSKTVSWRSWSDVKADFPTASLVGNCVVFNIGGNKFRLVARIRYRNHKVFVLTVMTHREYSDDKWKVECGCSDPPPSKRRPMRSEDEESQ